MTIEAEMRAGERARHTPNMFTVDDIDEVALSGCWPSRKAQLAPTSIESSANATFRRR